MSFWVPKKDRLSLLEMLKFSWKNRTDKTAFLRNLELAHRALKVLQMAENSIHKHFRENGRWVPMCLAILKHI